VGCCYRESPVPLIDPIPIAPPPEDAVNVLRIVLDDVGIEQLRTYGLSTAAVPMPNVEALARRGVAFARAYSYPICSPDRMCQRTGRFGFHTGIVALVENGAGAPPENEIFLPRVLELNAPQIESALIGKWHLSNYMNKDWEHPVRVGFDYWAGTLRNLERGADNYFNYEHHVARKLEKGEFHEKLRSRVYATTRQVDDAIAWINARTGQWYMELAFNAPHFPLHRPPTDLYDTSKYVLTSSEPIGSEAKRPYFKAMLQAIDTELGRLFRSIDSNVLANTVILVVGDNGTAAQVYDNTITGFTNAHAKGTVYEQACRVPLIVAGPLVDRPGRVDTTSLICAVDMFATELSLLSVGTTGPTYAGALDSVSFYTNIANASANSPRAYYFTETAAPNGRNLNASTPGNRGIGNASYKLVRTATGTTFPDAGDEFYQLSTDPWETTNLTPAGSTAGLNATQLSNYNTLKSSYLTLIAS